MVNVDISVWNDKRRMENLVYAKTRSLLMIGAVNALFWGRQEQWLMMAINLMFVIPAILSIISYFKYKKKPPIKNEKE